MNAKASSSSGVNFPLCIYNHLVTWGFGDLEIGDNLSETEAGQKICIVRLWCTQVRVSDRPSITEVVEMLEGNIDSLQMPPKPSLSSSTSPKLMSIEEDHEDQLDPPDDQLLIS